MDEHGEDEERRASQQWISAGRRKQGAERLRALEQRLELLGIVTRIVMGFASRAEESEIGIGEMFEVERTEHHLYDATRRLHLALNAPAR